MESINRGSSTLILDSNQEKHKIQEENSKIDSTKNVEYMELKLKLPKKVSWTKDTIDNEHMNKKKSKSKKNLCLITL
jgi:hypothetical protein